MGKEYTKPITMSWQAYVDQQLVGTGSCTSGAILGHDGSTWATSAGFAVSAAEGQKLASQFANPGSAQADGVNVAGTRYMCLRADDRSIYGKKGAGGVCCVKTNRESSWEFTRRESSRERATPSWRSSLTT